MLGLWSSQSSAGMVAIGNESLREIGKLDQAILGRVFTGRTVQIAGVAVLPVNLKAGSETRAAFIRAVLQQSDDDYIAYWIVRRSIGKGAPPPEMSSPQQLLDFVRSTPGAIGYVDDRTPLSGVAVLFTLP